MFVCVCVCVCVVGGGGKGRLKCKTLSFMVVPCANFSKTNRLSHYCCEWVRECTQHVIMSGIVSDTIPVLVLHSCSPTCQLGWCRQRGSVITTLMNFTIGIVCYPTILQVLFGVSLSEPLV